MRRIKHIVIHCSAGFAPVDKVVKFWKEKLKWTSVGYHYFIDEDGTVHQLADIANTTNGVAGFNKNSIHISYQGGVEKTNTSIPKDSRTVAQKKAFEAIITAVLLEVAKHQSIEEIEIKGHRDFSPDKNKNGIIEKWERIKECPSFDAIPEYQRLIQQTLKQLNS